MVGIHASAPGGGRAGVEPIVGEGGEDVYFFLIYGGVGIDETVAENIVSAGCAEVMGGIVKDVFNLVGGDIVMCGGKDEGGDAGNVGTSHRCAAEILIHNSVG